MDPAIFFQFWTCLAFKLNKKLSWIIDVDISEKSVVRITSKKKKQPKILQILCMLITKWFYPLFRNVVLI